MNLSWQKIFLCSGLLFACLCCVSISKIVGSQKPTFIEQLENVPDSIKVGNITIYNSFKNQILAHRDGNYDSSLIVKKVYQLHKQLWDGCYGTIFGETNAEKFNNPAGMVEWNRTLYPKNKPFFDKRAKQLLALNLNSTLISNLKKLIP